MDKHAPEDPPVSRVYGRRQSRPLRGARQEAMDALFPSLDVPASRLSQKQDLDPDTLFKQPMARYVLEIGFGNGEHLFGQLRQRPDTGFFGAEPYVNGMASFVKALHHNPPPPDNIRVIMDDAMILARSLTANSLDKIYVLNPDPWPKKRHHKRRFINRDNLDVLARILKPQGTLVMATDVDDLASWMVIHCVNHPALMWTAETCQDWQTPPPEWIETRYAFKGRTAGRRQTFLTFQKTPHTAQSA